MITFSEPTSKYFGVYHDLREEEFISVKSAIAAGAFAVIEILSKIRNNGTFKNDWYDYISYNENGVVVNSIQYLKWGLEIKSAFETSYGSEYDHTQVMASFIDPSGKKIGLGQQGTGWVGIRAALRKLKELTVYENYQNYSLSQKVNQLEKEVVILKNKLLENTRLPD